MAKIKIAKAVFDILWPVGSFYETSNTGFDPNTEWYGTWTRDTIGLVTVGAYQEGDYAYAGGSNDFANIVQAQVGEQVGEKNHKLTIDEMPDHNHDFQVAGTVVGPHAITGLATGGNFWHVGFARDQWSHDGGITGAGHSRSHNNVQPCVGVMRWHRTA